MRVIKIILIIVIVFIIIYFLFNKKSSISKSQNQRKEIVLKKANHYYESNKYFEGKILFDEFIKSDTTNAEAYYRRGYCKAQIYDYNGSIIDYQKALFLKQSPFNVYFNIGCDYGAIGKDSLAIVFFEKALELDPLNLKVKVEIDKCKNRLKSHKGSAIL